MAPFPKAEPCPAQNLAPSALAGRSSSGKNPPPSKSWLQAYDTSHICVVGRACRAFLPLTTDTVTRRQRRDLISAISIRSVVTVLDTRGTTCFIQNHAQTGTVLDP
ncbi:hypothetical protein Bbelb_088480 [Branchiostoma belcheri]|nr:hypothetical protein Bbelb_088480 [Branchiostoma belcheri]